MVWPEAPVQMSKQGYNVYVGPPVSTYPNFDRIKET